MIETHTRILGIAPYDGMRTAMEQVAQAYPDVYKRQDKERPYRPESQG